MTIDPVKLAEMLDMLAAQYADLANGCEAQGNEEGATEWRRRAGAAERGVALVRGGYPVVWDSMCETLLVGNDWQPGTFYRVNRSACDCPTRGWCRHMEVRAAADALLDAAMMATLKSAWEDYDGEGLWL